MARKRKFDHPKLPPKRVLSVIERLRSGEKLCRCFRPRAIGEADDVTIWWFEPSGKQVGPASARAVVSTPAAAVCDAGLLGSETAQSWQYAP